jgi:hypothetical protein
MLGHWVISITGSHRKRPQRTAGAEHLITFTHRASLSTDDLPSGLLRGIKHLSAKSKSGVPYSVKLPKHLQQTVIKDLSMMKADLVNVSSLYVNRPNLIHKMIKYSFMSFSNLILLFPDDISVEQASR